MDKVTKLSALMFQEAKRQFRAGEITPCEYEETLILLYEKLSDIEHCYTRKNYVLGVFRKEESRVNLLQTINFAMSLN